MLSGSKIRLLPQLLRNTSLFRKSSFSIQKMTLFTSPQEVLDFWFGTELLQNDLSTLKERENLWYSSGNPEFVEKQLQQKDLVESIVNNDIAYNSGEWNHDESPSATLAKIVILDQFPRSIYRGEAKAFVGDRMTPTLVRHILDKGWLTRLSYAERSFLILPLMHSEQLVDHELGMELSSKFVDDGSQEVKDAFKGLPFFMKSHYDVVKQFNRFPHRNELLVSELLISSNTYTYVVMNTNRIEKVHQKKRLG